MEIFTCSLNEFQPFVEMELLWCLIYHIYLIKFQGFVVDDGGRD